MKTKFLVFALTAALVAATGCSQRTPAPQTDTTKTAMQKKYNSEAECKADFPTAGDCVRQTTSTGAVGGSSHAGGGFFFMSPFFYPWGAVAHNNGSTSYNQRVPSSGYAPAPLSAQRSLASRSGMDFSRAPSRSSYASRSGGSVRGGFGSSSRGGFSSGG